MDGCLNTAALGFIGVAAAFDVVTGRIPDALTLPAFAVSVVARVALFGPWSSCAAAASSLVAISASSCFLRSSFCGGDWKVVLILGQLAGWIPAAAVVLASSLCCAAAWAVRRRLAIRYIPLTALWTVVAVILR